MGKLGRIGLLRLLSCPFSRLRALSSGGSVASPPPSPAMPKYKLADYRYGREEMLALYVKENKVGGGAGQSRVGSGAHLPLWPQPVESAQKHVVSWSSCSIDRSPMSCRTRNSLQCYRKSRCSPWHWSL